MLNYKEKLSERNFTAKNKILQDLYPYQPDGGKYKCAALFGKNYTYLGYE
jgi:hypothetical protein